MARLLILLEQLLFFVFAPKSRKWLIRPFLAWSDRTNVGNPSNLVRIVRNHSRGHISHHHVPRNTPPLGTPAGRVANLTSTLHSYRENAGESERWRERNQYFLSSSGSNRWVSWQVWQSKRSFQNVSSGQNYSAWRASVHKNTALDTHTAFCCRNSTTKAVRRLSGLGYLMRKCKDSGFP